MSSALIAFNRHLSVGGSIGQLTSISQQLSENGICATVAGIIVPAGAKTVSVESESL
jgi:hypothetical protein